MSRYDLEKLDNKLKIKHGFAFKGEYFANEGKYIVLTPGNFHEKGGFSREIDKDKYYNHSFSKEYLLKKGDLIFAMTEQAEGLLGSCAFIPEDDLYLHNQRLGLIEVDEKFLDKNYIYYLFKTKNVRKQIRRSSFGSKVKHTSSDRIYNIIAPIAPKNIQKKIGKFLKSLDEKIEINNEINKKLKERINLIYRYWFIQFDFPNKENLPYKSSGGKMIFNDKLNRKIPKDWIVKDLGSCCEIIKGELITKDSITDGDIKVVAAGKGFAYYHNCSNRNENIITISSSGNAGYVNFWREKIFASDCITVSGKNVTETILIFHYLKLIQKDLYRMALGSVQPHIYSSDLKPLKYLIPPSNIIRAFEEQVLSINEAIKINELENEKLAKTIDWLLPLLMKGQVNFNKNSL